MKEGDNAGDNKIPLGAKIVLFVAHLVVIFPAIIVTIVVMGLFHFVVADIYANPSNDTIFLVVIIVVGIIPLFISVAFLIHYKGNGAEKMRYLLSKLRFPGFWGASVRSANSGREKTKDCCAGVVFYTFFIGLIAVFLAFAFSFVGMSNGSYHVEQIHLLNGYSFFKPQLPEGLNQTTVYASFDGSADGCVAQSVNLIPGPVLEQHGKNVHPPDEGLVFFNTFAPGSVVSLHVTASSKMRLYYKKNETVVNNEDLVDSFDLSFNETAFTSYLVKIFSSDSSTRVSYDFLAKTMALDMKNGLIIDSDTKFVMKRDDVLLLERNSSRFYNDEYIQVAVGLFEHSRVRQTTAEWSYAALIVVASVVIMEQTLLLIVLSLHSGFTQKAAEDKKDRCNILGHINAILLFIAGVFVFSIGASFFEFALRDDWETEFSFLSTFYSGEQLIVPVGAAENPRLSFNAWLKEVKVSAHLEKPNSSSVQTIDCTPEWSLPNASFWSNDYYITEGYSLQWDIEATVPFNLDVKDKDLSIIYSDHNVTTSKYEFTPNKTGVYSLVIKEPTEKAPVVFNSVILKAPMYDFTTSSLWSANESFYDRDLEPEARFICVEPIKPNITAQNVYVSLEGRNTHNQKELGSYATMVSFALIFALLVVVAIVIMILDLVGSKLSCCFFCTSADTLQGEESSLIEKDDADK